MRDILHLLYDGKMEILLLIDRSVVSRLFVDVSLNRLVMAFSAGVHDVEYALEEKNILSSATASVNTVKPV